MKTIASVATLSLVVLCSCGTNSDSAQSGQDVSVATSTQQQGLECKFKPTAEMQEGLNLYKVAPGDELCGGYREGDHAISFQTLRGEDLVLGENTSDPDAPAYEVSVRFIDMGGNSFIMAVGHDERNASWHDVVPELVSEYTGQNRKLDFKLTLEAAKALENAQMQDFDVELTTLSRRSFTASLTPAEVSELYGEPDFASEDESINPHNKALQYKYWVRITKKFADWTGKSAYHTAVWVTVTRPTGETFSLTSCNHGTCADSSLMAAHCQRTAYSSSYRSLPWQPCDTISTYGLTSGHHVCNDDTIGQYSYLVYGVTETRYCADSILNTMPPNCY